MNENTPRHDPYQQHGAQPPYTPHPGQVQPWQPQQPHYPPQVAPKSVLGAAVISFFLPGVGTIYAGEVTWGIVILALWLISIPLTLVTIGLITGFTCWVVGMISGAMAAQRWNRAHGIIS